LSALIPLHDVNDAEGFVRATISKSAVRLTDDEREELVAEGLLILTALAKRYEPGRNGLDPSTSSFAGYAAQFLPGKLSDANHRLQENHRLVTEGDGRRWQYDERPASIEELAEAPGGIDSVRALQGEDISGGDMAGLLRSALDKAWERDREVTVQVGVLIGDGYALADIAARLRIGHQEAAIAVWRIKRVARTLVAT
jgi:hypothetical protein